ncbi:unnamed protein product [Paramecium octaurelia]|uniref:Tetratricopeptide repeat protein n=1 Tax=Paramecium octaurelia TaxID=43137 RepID=A0A8S1YK00_PAROT|nr:unnamed protein product [Paramecium octaurelia]
MKVFTCQDIEHEGETIQGFCLNARCKDSKPQFCLQCGYDPKKHPNCKKDLKGFDQIQSFITKFNQNILDLATQLNKSFAQVKIKYEEFSIQLENMKIQLVKISECFSQQDYSQMKANLQVIKEWYQYLNNQEEIMKQNQIGTQLVRIKKMIQALDLGFGFRQRNNKQDNNNPLYQGIQLLNQQKWQEANEKITEYIELSEKQQSLGTFFKSIALIEMQQPGQGMIMREQAKKINNNLYRDLLDYSNEQLRKNPQNTFILIAKSYTLNEVKQFQQAIELCEQVLREDPQHLHALYTKSFSLDELKQHSQAIVFIDVALKLNPQYIIGYFNKGLKYLDLLGRTLLFLKQYSDAIVCYDKAIQLDSTYAMAYMNKGVALHNLKQYDDAMAQYDKVIQLDPTFAMVYMNKGLALDKLKQYNDAMAHYDKAIQLDPSHAKAYLNKGLALLNFLQKYNDAIVYYDKAIQLDPTYAKAYKKKGDVLKIIKNYSLALKNYEQAILNCQSDQEEFKRLIVELKNQK